MSTSTIPASGRKSYNERNYIDPGLATAWLDRVNNLSHWAVGSSCEGHHRRKSALQSDHARVSLHPRDTFLEVYLNLLRTDHSALNDLAHEAFERADTCYRLCGRRSGQLVSEPIVGSVVRHAGPPVGAAIEACLASIRPCAQCLLDIDHTESRVSDDMPPSVSSWLEHIANRLVFFDTACRNLVHEQASRPPP